jgi:heme exporter protein D
VKRGLGSAFRHILAGMKASPAVRYVLLGVGGTLLVVALILGALKFKAEVDKGDRNRLEHEEQLRRAKESASAFAPQ